MSSASTKARNRALASDAVGTPVEFRGLSKSFGTPAGTTLTVLSAVHFEAPAGHVTAICGPSGCGKSTMLWIAAGLEKGTHGEVTVGERVISGVSDARAAGVGLITQDANLLPWLTVLENVALPLKFMAMPKKQRLDRAREWLEKMQIAAFENFYPSQLSGGMQKRCAMARTMAYEPKVLLMDEPFGALDAMTRLTLQCLLCRLVEESGGLTVVLVTHDLSEAIALGDRIVMISGRPGRVCDVVDVPISRPRDVDRAAEHPMFGPLHSRLREALTGPVAKAGAET